MTTNSATSSGPSEARTPVGFKHILVPTDFGEAAEHAIDVAAAMASKFESRLTLFHASWLPASAQVEFGEGLPWPTDDYAERATRALEALASKVRTRYPQRRIECLVTKGEAWVEILRAAKDRGADLIVMGTHGRRWLAHVFLGSVAEKVTRLSHVPVMTVSGKAEEDARNRALAQLVRP